MISDQDRSRDILDNIFSKALQGKTLFKNHKALQSDFVPDHLPFRNTQLSSIAEILAPILHGSKPSNLLIYGKTGAGKTAAARHITTKLAETATTKKKKKKFFFFFFFLKKKKGVNLIIEHF